MHRINPYLQKNIILPSRKMLKSEFKSTSFVDESYCFLTVVLQDPPNSMVIMSNMLSYLVIPTLFIFS